MALFKYYPSNPKKLDAKMEKRIFIHSLIFPAVFVFVFWMVKLAEHAIGTDFVELGIYPLHVNGLPGILFSPFIHSNYSHLISNSVPFFILLAVLVYFYRRISYRIFFRMYVVAGFCTWVFGREAWHIGASGVVYAMAAFHFVSGIIRNDVRLLTVSVVVVFLYGGLMWGLLPIKPEISWEGHLWGAVSGVLLAFYYRKYLIRRDKFDWEDEDDEDEENGGFSIEDHENDTNSSLSEIQSKTNSSVSEKPKSTLPGNVSHSGQFLLIVK